MSKSVQLAVEVGYELRAVQLTAEEWDSVKRGEPLNKFVRDFYEGEEMTYQFHFNSALEEGSELVVTYGDGGVGFIGDIADAHLS